ncbi:hypothetical protein D3C76_1553300 [compost metagenome]
MLQPEKGVTKDKPDRNTQQQPKCPTQKARLQIATGRFQAPIDNPHNNGCGKDNAGNISDKVLPEQAEQRLLVD